MVVVATTVVTITSVNIHVAIDIHVGVPIDISVAVNIGVSVDISATINITALINVDTRITTHLPGHASLGNIQPVPMIRLQIVTRVTNRVNSFKFFMVISSFLFRVFSGSFNYGKFDLVSIFRWNKSE